ncbi:hypothetical protein DFJ58DRAFT_50807 [Suillus subalutaceus]|uniref:uncharacterized protein n=1 Tax=Suillus subalutaceus TaxID=48586 RepID=UPI001B8696A9|nr:uncharacterized protein DFJ58DRAFT_50807 [Suillus subalutaceus]KAG1842879.1 hypothetical protein DFJ58DRAFT_50807 [Suillus subalutaceus]
MKFYTVHQLAKRCARQSKTLWSCSMPLNLVQVHPRPPNVFYSRVLAYTEREGKHMEFLQAQCDDFVLSGPHSSSIAYRQLGLTWYFPGTSSYKAVLSEVVDTETCPSEPSNRSLCTWNKYDLVPRIKTPGNDYIDETRDLYVTIDILETHQRNSKFKINFRQLSTGEEHPFDHESQLVTVIRPTS